MKRKNVQTKNTNDYNGYLIKIDEVKSKLKEIDDYKKATVNVPGYDFQKNPKFFLAQEREEKLLKELNDLNEGLTRLETITSPKVTVKVDIGKSVKLLFIDQNEEEVYKLRDGKAIDPLNNEISTESPLGRALIGVTKGEKINYSVNNDKVSVQVVDIF